MRTPGGFNAIETQAQLGGFFDKIVDPFNLKDKLTGGGDEKKKKLAPAKKPGLREFDYAAAMDRETKKQTNVAERLRQQLDINEAAALRADAAATTGSILAPLQKAAPWALGACAVIAVLYMMKRRK